MKKLSVIFSLAIIAILATVTITNAAVDYHEAASSSSAANKPSCSSAIRGLFWLVQSGASVADYPQVCRKNSNGTVDSYAWASFTLQ